ncbi:DUF6265 family protein [Sphingopyxis sp.]|jgi:hypothetical protein|uniref:DUF6265 family protein n=1 Tax=Sphingopyxis sp. TaxID=1908224 RepID=UPI0025FE6527|nr:DUF6265 family protein [Sphingopyxis sp.]MBK6412629.1 hypothetical protein [Sphingopyxis sp.]
MKIILAMTAAAVLAAASPAATVDDLAWLAGQWSREEVERWTEESWTLPRGGVMLGHSRSGRGDSLREFEFLRIAAGADGVPAYIAQPGGGAAVAFRLVQRGGTSATFENAAHDYPQRIIYVRDGDAMTATVSLIDGSKPMRWTFHRR